MSIDTLGSLWQRPDRNGSSHYGVNGTQVGQYVKESDIAWTDGNWDSNKRSVTIETANSTLAPNWEIGTATYNTLVKLVADIARRNNLVPLKLPVQNAQGKWVEEAGTNLTWHSMYSATACPGNDLFGLMGSIVSQANQILNEGPSEAVYVIKDSSDVFLGTNGTNTVRYVTSGDAKGFKMSMSNGRYTFSDFSNPNLKLQVDADGVTPLLAPVTSTSKLAYGEYVDGKLKIFIESGSATFSTRAIVTKLFMSTATYPISAKFSSSTDYFNIQDNKIAKVTAVPSTIASGISALIGKTVKFKHKSSGTYLSYGSSSHLVGIGNSLSLKNKTNNLDQVWIIKDLGDGIYGLVSKENENYAVEIEDEYGTCVSGASSASGIWKRGISIEDAGNGSYKLKFTKDNRYISNYTYQNAMLLRSYESNGSLWEIEEIGNYLTYPTKVMRITQRHDGDYSHPSEQISDYKDYPVDEGCEASNDRGYMYCPCDEMEVLRIRGLPIGNDDPTKTNTIWLRSTTPVQLANGEKDYIVLMVIHPNDDDLSLINIGHRFKRGEPMFIEGTDGGVGEPFHFSISRGDVVQTSDGLGERQATFVNPNDQIFKILILATTGEPVIPDKAFYLDENFTTVAPHIDLNNPTSKPGNNNYNFVTLPY